MNKYQVRGGRLESLEDSKSKVTVSLGHSVQWIIDLWLGWKASSTRMNKDKMKTRPSHVVRPPHYQLNVLNVQKSNFARSNFKLLLSFGGLVPAPRGIFHHLVYVRPRQCPTTQLFQRCDAQRNCNSWTIMSISGDPCSARAQVHQQKKFQP